MSGKKTAFTPEQLLAALQRFPVPGVYWVAFSGGADSTALLQALFELNGKPGAPVKALHVNHGLHPESAAWQQHCEAFCRTRGIYLECVEISVDRGAGKGLEAEARRQRYGVASGLLGEGDVLLTAHHSDDQAETLLLNLMRGSGIEGLAGMPERRPLGKGFLARPLLAFSGLSLQAYLRDGDIDWIEDSSNADQSYDRNYLRHSLLPVLERRWHGAADKIGLSARHSREAAGLLSGMADDALEKHLVHPQVLSLDAMANPVRFKHVIRRWLQRQGAPALPARQLEELCRQCAHASPAQRVKLNWEDWSLQLFRGQLWLQCQSSIARCPELEWATPGRLDLGPVLGQLAITPGSAGLPPGLAVRPRKGGEKIHFSAGGLHRSVKHLLQEATVPPWMRSSVPLLCLDGEPVALGDWAIGSRLQAWLDGHGTRLTWEPAEPLLRLVHSTCGPGAVDPPVPLG